VSLRGLSRLTLLQTLFDSAAPDFARYVAPFLAPLYDDFIAYASPLPGDRALDLGAGTGEVARRLLACVRLVTGIDLARRALTLARTTGLGGAVGLVQGDLERLPFRAGSFTLITASFALHGAVPQRSLPALHHALAEGGRLVIQEWGPADPLHLALDDLLAYYATDEPSPALSALRQALHDLPPLWGDWLQDVGDYREWLDEYGFAVEDAQEVAPLTLRLPSVEAYLHLLLARPDRRLEVNAMSPQRAAAFREEARALLLSMAAASASIAWSPTLLRVRARRL
jgi:SAM-dependent methyltransferase